jgi:hypothetical protein
MKYAFSLAVAPALVVLAAACSGAVSNPGPTAANDAGAEGGGDSGSANDGGTGGDGGTAGDGGTVVDGGAACPQYTAADKACMTPADCTTVAKGCYCGSQPVIGISKSIGAVANECERTNAMNCALGCAISSGQHAEDGNTTDDGGTIAVLCDNMQCHTVVQ